MKTTLKDIKHKIEMSVFIDLNEIDENWFKSVVKYYDIIAYSLGVYGVTGKVIYSYYDNRLYAITERNTRFFSM